MTSKYEFDAERWLRNWSARKRFTQADGRDPFAMCADELHRLRMAVDLHEQGAELMREEMTKLKEAARPVVKWYTRSKRHFPDEFRPRDVALEYDGPLGHVSVICLELDALAALVGEG